MLTFAGGTSILTIGEKLLLGFETPEEPGAPPRILFRVFDRRGVEAFSIIGNEIRCQNDAFDVEAIGARWRVHSAPRNIDLVVRFDPPTRITVERLHFSHLSWELVVEGPSFSLRFVWNPIVTIGGPAKIRGRCLYVLAENKPHVFSSSMNIVFGGRPSPIGTQPMETGNGFRVVWPILCLISTADGTANIRDFNGQRALCLYTRESFAKTAQQDSFQIQALSSDECRRLVDGLGGRGLIDIVAFNLDPTQPTTTFQWSEFVMSLSEGAVESS